ncbi:MAG: diacylglycerol kinase family protein [Baekduia sp.]
MTETLSLQALRDQARAGSDRKRLLLITNPHASTVTTRLQRLVQYALAGGFELDCVRTKAQGDATRLAAEAAADGVDAVVVFSGDGTINEAANGLHGTKTALTCLPGGSGNVYNKMLGLPVDVIDATERLLRRADEWETRAVLMGAVNDRRFLFSAGYGLDAAIVGHVDSNPRWKHKLNERYFTYSAFRVYFTRYLSDPPKIETTWTGCDAPLQGVTTLVQKGDPYTYFDQLPLRACKGARLEDPVFSGMSLRTTRPTIVPGIVWRLFSQTANLTDHRQIDAIPDSPEIVVRSTDGRPVDLMVDGDNIGQYTEARFTIDPVPLTILG